MKDIGKSLVVLALCAVGAGAAEMQALKTSPIALGSAELPAAVGLAAVAGKPAAELSIRVGPGHGPGHRHSYTRTVSGGPFRSERQARRAMRAKVAELQREGKTVLSAMVTRSYRGFGYQVTYKGRYRRW